MTASNSKQRGSPTFVSQLCMIHTAVTAAKAVTALYGPPSNFGLNVHSCQSLTDCCFLLVLLRHSCILRSFILRIHWANFASLNPENQVVRSANDLFLETFKQPFTNSSSFSSPSLSMSSWLNTIFALFSAVSWHEEVVKEFLVKNFLHNSHRLIGIYQMELAALVGVRIWKGTVSGLMLTLKSTGKVSFDILFI